MLLLPSWKHTVLSIGDPALVSQKVAHHLGMLWIDLGITKLRCYEASVLQALGYASRRCRKPWVLQTLGAKIPRCKKHWVLGCYESWALQNLQPSRLEGFAKQGTRVLTERRRLAKSRSS